MEYADRQTNITSHLLIHFNFFFLHRTPRKYKWLFRLAWFILEIRNTRPDGLKTCVQVLCNLLRVSAMFVSKLSFILCAFLERKCTRTRNLKLRVIHLSLRMLEPHEI